jgi:hypothetical protein
MVEDFSFITDDGVVLKLNLGVKEYIFEGNEEHDISQFYKSKSVGVRWMFDHKVIDILESSVSIEGYPTPDRKRVVVVYRYDHPVYSSPNNAILYNADGSIHLQLKVPGLISDLAKKRSRFLNYESPLRTYFDNARWDKNSKGELVSAVRIGFDRDWLETRELNSDTGEFGECLSSGLR